MVSIIKSDPQYLRWIVVGCTKPNLIGAPPKVFAVLRQLGRAVFQTGERIVGLLDQCAQAASQIGVETGVHLCEGNNLFAHDRGTLELAVQIHSAKAHSAPPTTY